MDRYRFINSKDKQKKLPSIETIFLLVDEFNMLLDNSTQGNDKMRGKVIALLESIACLGGKTGIHLVVSTQDPRGIPEELDLYLDARLALGDMDRAYYEAASGFDPLDPP